LCLSLNRAKQDCNIGEDSKRSKQNFRKTNKVTKSGNLFILIGVQGLFSEKWVKEDVERVLSGFEINKKG